MEIWHFKRYPQLGLRGRLPTFIENFLADCTMQVRVGSSLSDYYDQEQGVPQGGVLSTTLFSIKINDIVKCLGNLTDCSLYVDDFCICYRSKGMATIERQLQQNLNKIENWATSNGFEDNVIQQYGVVAKICGCFEFGAVIRTMSNFALNFRSNHKIYVI